MDPKRPTERTNNRKWKAQQRGNKKNETVWTDECQTSAKRTETQRVPKENKAGHNKKVQTSKVEKYKESLWKTNREILPAIAAEPFTSFDSYINISEQLDSDSTSLTLLAAGDPGLPNNVVDHFLVRAPKDMYNGTLGTVG